MYRSKFGMFLISIIIIMLLFVSYTRSYVVTRKASGDVIEGYVENCNDINAKKIQSYTGETTCRCWNNGTFVYFQNYTSCYTEIYDNFGLQLLNISVIPFVRNISGSWRLPDRKLVFVHNKEIVTKSKCPYLNINRDQLNYEMMIDGGWESMKDDDDFFNVKTATLDSYHIKLGNEHPEYFIGGVYRLWLDCQTTPTLTYQKKYTFLLKFEGAEEYVTDFTTPSVDTISPSTSMELTSPTPTRHDSTRPPTPLPSGSNGTSVGLIIGGVAGGIFVAFLIIIVAYCWNKRRMERKELSNNGRSPRTTKPVKPVSLPNESKRNPPVHPKSSDTAYIQPNIWTSSKNNLQPPDIPPPVPDSPRPSQYHSYEYPTNDLYMDLAARTESNNVNTAEESQYADLQYRPSPAPYVVTGTKPSTRKDYAGLNQLPSNDVYMGLDTQEPQNSYSQLNNPGQNNRDAYQPLSNNTNIKK